MSKRKVLLFSQDESQAQVLSVMLRREGYDCVTLGKTADLESNPGSYDPDFILSDVPTPEKEAYAWISDLHARNARAKIFALVSDTNADFSLEAIRSGAYDVFRKPVRAEELIVALRKADEREGVRSGESPTSQVSGGNEYLFSNIVAKSRQMTTIFKTIQKIAEFKTTVLLMGESGTGKELVARAVHFNSSRAKKPFITVNCGAIPENLLESELFGHVKGAFTGAVRTRKGLFEEADQGTLFLDEIGELPLLLQVKLLRALQEEEIRKVGDTASQKVDVRIIAATVKNLAKEVEQGTFREDLYYRLNVLPIHMPPLRERKEDIPILVDAFLAKYRSKLNVKVKSVGKDAMNILLNHDWPGNVRELENTIERAMVMAVGESLEVEHLPANLKPASIGPSSFLTGMGEEELSIKKMSRVMEENLILKALKKCGGNRTKASKLLEISHRALLYKIKRYGLESQILEIEQELEAERVTA